MKDKGNVPDSPVDTLTLNVFTVYPYAENVIEAGSNVMAEVCITGVIFK
jgi:hypothetical protein